MWERCPVCLIATLAVLHISALQMMHESDNGVIFLVLRPVSTLLLACFAIWLTGLRITIESFRTKYNNLGLVCSMYCALLCLFLRQHKVGKTICKPDPVVMCVGNSIWRNTGLAWD